MHTRSKASFISWLIESGQDIKTIQHVSGHSTPMVTHDTYGNKLDPKLIVFDWDDVITLGAKEGYFACYDLALAKVGIGLPEEVKTNRILRRWGTNHREELTELLQENPGLVDEAAKAYEEALFGEVFATSLRIIEGTQKVIENLATRYKLAVATGGHPKVLKERIIPKFRIPPVLEIILSGYEINDASKTKPDPYMLNVIMDQVGVKNTATIHVGDAKNNVLMAQRASVEPVVVFTGHLSSNQAEALGVAHVLPDVTLIESILQK